MPRVRHNLSHDRLFTCNMGQLIPCSLIEVLPGDEFRMNSSVMVRLSPLAAPVMHGMTIRLHHFFIPHRLAWSSQEDWEAFITGGEDGTDASTVPTRAAGSDFGIAEGSLADYLGIPPTTNGMDINSVPLKAYNLVYNEWYRDTQLIPERTAYQNSVANVAYEKDYYTIARPAPQLGAEVTLPLGTQAPVYTDAAANGDITVQSTSQSDLWKKLTASTANVQIGTTTGIQNDGLFADLQNATAATINSLRLASGLQRFAEARNRFGTRYAEYVRYAFGARPLDARIQRPEYLGGSSQRVSISEIIQSAPDATERSYGVGDLYGHGIAMTRSNRFRRAFQEHGYIMSLFSCRPKSVYANGLARHFIKTDREDFFQKELAYIGQQQVYGEEVYASLANTGTVFGWSDRYADYRYMPSSVHGEFRSTLDYWHLARDFGAAPALNQTFIEVTPSDTKRIFNEQTADSLWVACSNQVQARRVVPRRAESRLL